MASRKKREDVENPDLASSGSVTPNKWLMSLTAFDRNRVYSLTSYLAEQANGLTQNDFIEQYSMGERNWRADFDRMFGVDVEKK